MVATRLLRALHYGDVAKFVVNTPVSTGLSQVSSTNSSGLTQISFATPASLTPITPTAEEGGNLEEKPAAREQEAREDASVEVEDDQASDRQYPNAAGAATTPSVAASTSSHTGTTPDSTGPT